MIEMHMGLRALRQIALAADQSERDVVRTDVSDILERAGWENSARIAIDSIGRPVVSHDAASDDQEGPSQQG